MQDDIERKRAAIKLANQTDLSNAAQVIVVGGGVNQIDKETFSKTVANLAMGECETIFSSNEMLSIRDYHGK